MMLLQRLALALCLSLGFSPAWATPALWDNSDGHFTLSGGDLIATRDQAPTNTYLSLKSTTSHRGAKVYFEIVVGGYANSQWMAGIVNSNGSMTARLGVEAVGNQDAFGAGFDTGGALNGYFYHNGTQTADKWTTSAPVDGDVIGFAVDGMNGLIWVNKNNGAWNEASAGTQDPATGQGGFLVSGLTTIPFYIAASGLDNGTAQVFTLHASAASLAASPPSGFTVWDDAADPPAAIVDGIANGFGVGTSITTGFLTTAFPNDRIAVFTYSHDNAVTSVTASSGVPGGFTLRKSVLGASTEWWGTAVGTLSNVTITANLSGSSDISVIAFGVHGAFSQALPFFDPEGTLPVAAGPATTTGCHLAITTDNPQDLMFYSCGAKGPLVNVVTPLGWELLVNTQYPGSMLMVAARLTGAPQTSLDINPSVSDLNDAISIGDAVNGVGGGTGIIPFSPLTGFR
jgi:hypothetical protein